MLCGVHAADLGAVGLALFGSASGANALDEHDGMGMLSVGGSEESTGGGACRVGETFKFKRSDDVLGLAVRIFIVLFHGDGFKSGCGYDCAVLFFDDLVGLLIVDGACGTYFRTYAALAGFQHGAVIGVNGCYLRYCLCEGDVYGTSVVHTQVEFVGHLLLGALFGTQTASGALGFVYVSCFLSDLDGEVAHKSADRFHFGVGVDLDLFVLCTFHHLRGEDTCRAVKGREGLVDLGHLAADGGLLFHDVHFKSGFRNIQSGLDACDTAADDKGSLGYGGLACLKRSVEMHLCDGRSAEDDRLFGTFLDILMDPGALFSNVGYFHHVGVQSCRLCCFSECSFVHSGGAGADDNACELIVTDGILDHVLTGFGAHILVIHRVYHAVFVGQRFRHSLYVHRCRDIGTAVADKYAYSLHFSRSSFTLYTFSWQS